MAADAAGGGSDGAGRRAAPEIRSRVLPRNWVPRPRLDDQLDRAVARPLTLLVAPAGSGKTVMLQSWVARAPGGRRRAVRMVTVRPDPVSGGSSAVGAVLDPEVLRSGPDGPQVVVVDDAHLLTPADLRLITETLERHPHSLRLVLATRRDLALPLVELGLRDALTEIRADQLLFRDDEATALIAAHAPGASELDVLTVRERGHGWAAALVLGARAVSGAADPVAARHALSVTEQPVLDYLLGEVFDTLDARVCHVLLCTCTTDTVTAEDAVAMSADPEAPALLSRLAAEGMLVTSSSESPAGGPPSMTFTFHPLLVELLRRRMATATPERALHAAAQVRVVEHHVRQGDIAGALHYATRLADQTWSVRLLGEHGAALLAFGQVELVQAALVAVSAGAEDEPPAVTAVRALERRVTGDPGAAIHLAALAIQAADASDDGSLADTTVILRCWLARIGIGSTMTAVARGRERLGCLGPSPSGHQHFAPSLADATRAIRGWVLTEVAVGETWLGDLVSARLHIEAATTTAAGLGADLPLAQGLVHLSVIDWAAGRLAAAERHARHAISLASAAGVEREAVFVRAHLVLSWVALQRFDLAETYRELVVVRRWLAEGHDLLVEVAEHLLTGYLLVRAGDIVGTRAQLETFPAPHEPLPAFLEAHLCVLRAWCALESGDPYGLDVEVDTLVALGLHDEADVIRGLALDLRGDTAGSLAAFRRVTEAREPLGARLPATAVASAYQAWISLREGDLELARTQVRDLKTLMTPHQRLYVTVLADQPGMAELLTEVTGPEPPAAEVIDLRPEQPARRVPVQRVDQDARRIELTAREGDVLRELSLGGSYADIAETLYITENTVKTHLASLYRKLGATRRSDALRAARRAGLLAS